MTPVPLCPNCARPVRFIATYPDGSEGPQCDRCNTGVHPVSVRPVEAEDITAAPSPPLTIPEAAERERVSDRTIRRRLPDLEAMTPPGAWKHGTAWRISPDALDALRANAPKVRRASRSTAAKVKPSDTVPSRRDIDPELGW